MKSKHIKILTIFGVLSLVGSASAAWVYSENASAEASIGIEIAEYSREGVITVTKSDTTGIMFDKADDDISCSFYWKNGSSIVATLDIDDSELPEDEYTVTKIWTAEIINNSGDTQLYYVSETQPDGITYENGTSDSYGDIGRTCSGTWENDVPITLPNFVWAFPQPDSKADRDKMATNLAKQYVKFTFTSTIVKNS